jgi:hypothetical protein
MRTQAEISTLADVLQRRGLGSQEWKRSSPTIGQLWLVLREVIEKMDLPYPRLRVYQDELANNEREIQMVMDLAQTGSPNHQLLLFLIQKGATLVGTESPELLLEDYQLVRQALDAQIRGESEEVRARQQFLRYALLERRDRYIAQRINDTLPQNETGILFLDMLHSVRKHLHEDVRVLYPILRPAGET